jgi:putative ABC transport system ATP-binding protein
MGQSWPVLIELMGAGKDFGSPGRRLVRALGEVDLGVDEGSSMALMGPSGSGKSTLLHLVGGLDRPTRGRVLVGGGDVASLRGRALASHRRSVGFVFQRFNLLGALSVLDNVLVPTVGAHLPDAPARAREALAMVGLDGYGRERPDGLSGGEQQRVAIARAIVNRPPVLLADEPTGALDQATGADIIALLLGLRADGTTVVIATHDYAVAARCERLVTLRDGDVVGDRALGTPADPRITAERVGALGAMNG